MKSFPECFLTDQALVAKTLMESQGLKEWLDRVTAWGAREGKNEIWHDYIKICLYVTLGQQQNDESLHARNTEPLVLDPHVSLYWLLTHSSWSSSRHDVDPSPPFLSGTPRSAAVITVAPSEVWMTATPHQPSWVYSACFCKHHACVTVWICVTETIEGWLAAFFTHRLVLLFLTCDASARGELSSLTYRFQHFSVIPDAKLNMFSPLGVTKSHTRWIYANACEIDAFPLGFIAHLCVVRLKKKMCHRSSEAVFSPRQPPEWTFPLFASRAGECWCKLGSTHWH